jgi:hypothetical protein
MKTPAIIGANAIKVPPSATRSLGSGLPQRRGEGAKSGYVTGLDWLEISKFPGRT